MIRSCTESQYAICSNRNSGVKKFFIFRIVVMWFDCMWTGIYRCVSCDEAVALNVCSSLVLRIYWHFVWSSDGGINTKMIRSIRRRWRCIWIALQFHMAMKFSHVFVCLFFSHVSMCVCSECHEVGFNTHFNGFVYEFLNFNELVTKRNSLGKNCVSNFVELNWGYTILHSIVFGSKFQPQFFARM